MEIGTIWKDNPDFQEGSIKARFAVVRIEATVDYLTAKDEESEADGWREIETRLTDYLKNFNRHRDKSVPYAGFVKWEEAFDA